MPLNLEQYRVIAFQKVRSPWRDDRDEAMRDAVALGLAEYDEQYRTYFLSAGTWIQRRPRPSG